MNFNKAAYASGGMSNSEMNDNDKLKAEISKLKEQQKDSKKSTNGEISSLRTKLKEAQQQISLLEADLQKTKQEAIEELQLKGMCIRAYAFHKQ